MRSSNLHLAALSNQTQLARELLIKGADPNIQDNYGDTPLHYVARGFYFDLSIEFLIELIKAGADVNRTNVKG